MAIDQSSQGFLPICELLKCTEDFGFLRPLDKPEISLLMDKYTKALVSRDYSSINNEVQMLCTEHHLLSLFYSPLTIKRVYSLLTIFSFYSLMAIKFTLNLPQGGWYEDEDNVT